MSFEPGRAVVFRNACVLTVERAGVIERGDVLVVGDTIAEVGVDVPAPPDAVEIDASGGILMPGMIDTHRHVWQAALRVVKHDGRRIDLPLAPVRDAVAESVEHVRKTLGETAWYQGMHPEIADIENPYSYTDAGDAKVRAASGEGRP